MRAPRGGRTYEPAVLSVTGTGVRSNFEPVSSERIVRILVLTDLYPPVAEGGYERRCAYTISGLSSRYEFFVLTSRRDHRGVPEDPTVRRELPFVDGRRDSFWAPVTAVQAARSMRSAIADWDPDLIFVWNVGGVPRSSVWVAQQSGVPIAFHVASPYLKGLYANDRFARHLSGGDRGVRRPWAGLIRLVNAASGLRMAPGTPFEAAVSWVSQALAAHSPPPPFVYPRISTVIYPATRRFEAFAAARRHPEAGEPLIAFVGRLEQQKGPDVALRAVAHLTHELGIPVRIELAGPGKRPYRRELETLVGKLGIAERVNFRGPLELDGVIDLMERAHVLLAPAVWQEPLPTTIIEAALAGLPVVASLSGGMPEALRPDAEALYFPIADWRACARALADTLGDLEATDSRVKRARARAQTFSFEEYLENMVTFIDTAAASLSETASPRSFPGDAQRGVPPI